MRALDQPATEHAIAVIEHERLSRRERGDRFIECQLDLVIIETDDLRGRRVRTMPHLHVDALPDDRRIDEPVHLTRNDTAAEQLLPRPDNHRAVAWPDVDDVHRLAESAGQSATLPDREPRVSAVLADDAAVAPHARSGPERVRLSA